MKRIGILGSTRGTHLTTIANAIQEKKLQCKIEIVISNKQDALILERAKSLNLKTEFVSVVDSSSAVDSASIVNLSREAFDKKISKILKENSIDLIILIGYMRILSAEFISDWENKIINVHPSLLPLHANKMDLAVHESVLDAHEKKSGCTVHYVTEKVDAGPIILQKTCEVFSDDTAESLKSRVQKLEGEALIEVVSEMCGYSQN